MRGRLPFGLAALVAVTASLGVLAWWSPAADAVASRFLVNGGDTYTRGAKVSVGDAGRSPFFGPGVVVWDGGSIVAGHRADPAFKFPVQTLSLVPRACESFVSASPGAKIADMIAAAPLEVDARYRGDADLNVSLVLAGGGDLRQGVPAASLLASLRTYCEQRREAGFRVIVLSVLPSHRTETFEASRLAFNAMVRDGWQEFADGLADIGADPRIGDSGDEYDGQYYQTDQLHLTNAGNAVMAAVTAPVLSAQPWTSARCELRVRDAAGDWSEWRPWSAAFNLWLEEYEGPHRVEAEYRLDGGAPVSVADTIFLDSVHPAPLILRNVAVRRGKPATLRFQVDDAEPCGPTATAYVTLQTRAGRVVKTFVRRRVPVNEPSALTFICDLPKGSYRWVMRARDTAGNPDEEPAAGKLTVR